MFKCLPTFVSGGQKSVLVDFISQNKVKILHKVKIWQNWLYQKFPCKTNKFIFFKHFLKFLSCYENFMRNFI